MSPRPAPCPVCGNIPAVVTRQKRCHVHCTACGEGGPVQGSRDAALAAWAAIAQGHKR